MTPGRPSSWGITLAGLFILAGVSCHPADDRTDLLPPANFLPPPVRPLNPNPPGAERVGYGLGFYPPDVLGDGRTWHWMARTGEVRLRNDGSTRRLRLLGRLPSPMGEAPRIDITLGGHPLDRFVVTETTFRKEYVLSADVLGPGRSVLLRVETSGVTRVPGDSRELGVSIEQLDWDIAD